jgi:hypothetical protein
MWEIMKRKQAETRQRAYDQERTILEMKYEIDKLKRMVDGI